MLNKLKKSEKISFIATIILLIALIGFIPIVLNIKSLLGIGYFSFGKNYISEYPEGTVGINVKITIRHLEGNRCRGSILVRPISSGNIDIYGITQIQYVIKKNNHYNSVENTNVNSATQIWSRLFYISVREYDNISCTGTTEIRYGVNGLEQTAAYNFDISYIIPISVSSISYLWDMPLIWLNFLYFIFLFVVIFFLVRQYRHIKFIYRYSEEMKERDEIFFKAISEKRQYKKK